MTRSRVSRISKEASRAASKAVDREVREVNKAAKGINPANRIKATARAVNKRVASNRVALSNRAAVI